MYLRGNDLNQQENTVKTTQKNKLFLFKTQKILREQEMVLKGVSCSSVKII